MNYSERRDKEVLSGSHTVRVPPGPGWGAFYLSVLLAGLVAGLFVWLADQKRESEQGGVTAHGGLGLRADVNGTLNFLVRAKAEHAPESGAGVTENFLRGMPHLTDGDVQPLWPWVMAGQVSEGYVKAGMEVEHDRRLIDRVKQVEKWMAAGLILLCGVMAARTLHPAAMLPALLPGALLALLAYGTDFGTTGMNYILVFLCWLCALTLLANNNVWLHGIFGILTGLAWLTDATALFIVAAWLVAATGRWVWTSLRSGEQAEHEEWIARNHFVGLVALVVGWVAVCGPRCGAAMDHWGRPLFSWQQHWMWQDSAQEALAVTDRYEDVRALENGRRMDLPGWDEYWQKHTREQARDRMESGWEKVWGEFTGSGVTGSLLGKPSGARRVLWLGGAGVLFGVGWLAALRHWRRPKDEEGDKAPSYSPAPALFVLVAAGCYGSWYAWYAPVQSDPRFLMVLYMPLVWTLVQGAEKLVTVARTRGACTGLWLGWRVALWVFSAVLAADVGLLLSGTDVMEFFARR